MNESNGRRKFSVLFFFNFFWLNFVVDGVSMNQDGEVNGKMARFFSGLLVEGETTIFVGYNTWNDKKKYRKDVIF